MTSENPYKVAYAQYTTKTVAPNISTTNVVEIGERHQDNIGNGMRATGEFARNVYQGAVDNGETAFYGVVIGLLVVGGIFFYPVVGATGLVVGTATGLAMLFTKDESNKSKKEH